MRTKSPPRAKVAEAALVAVAAMFEVEFSQLRPA
jgi:hypothetical protein